MDEYETINLDATPGGIGVITLDRADKHNAFNAQVIEELTDALETIEEQETLRMVILRANGKSFSAGADLTWMKAAADYTRHENEQDAYRLAEMLRKLANLPQMTVALVQGAAMGGGAGLVAACDIAVAMQDAKFRFSEVRLGLTPATISPFVISAIGPRWAKALFVSAESFDAAFAEKIGLVQYVVEDQAGLTQMEEYLASLAMQAAPGAVGDAKQLVLDLAGMEINQALSHETAKRIAHRRASDEGKEGLAAFLEKRKPDWAE
ncbi:enoyl-CoA hydratase-related protein [Henriciella aquimarina]|uniref:enoyl-CoA hydratase-related protein n=1 Tax=Henriciella aquimarina TaxID=545261 RepID=UPI0009FBC4A0|nr:enoyl-CoA hydratase-related protein [Henriciella aquimarina]